MGVERKTYKEDLETWTCTSICARFYAYKLYLKQNKY